MSMTDLSPAAQAMIDAFFKDYSIASALHALAVRIHGADAIRQDVLDIAAELERTSAE